MQRMLVFLMLDFKHFIIIISPNLLIEDAVP